ncbi:protein SLOW GREEN 1, chloroplastic [Sarracenia purpurea var. burkii]
MESALTIRLESPIFHFKIPSQITARNPSSNPTNRSRIRTTAAINHTPRNGGSSPNPILHKLKITAAAAAVVLAASASAGKFRQLPARAESPASATQEKITVDEARNLLQEEDEKTLDRSSPLSQFLDSNSKAVEALKSLLQQKLEAGEDEEALKILKNLVSAQPDQIEWKFLLARLLSEIGSAEEALEVFEEILKQNPLSFEALFENALLMDRCGEGNAVITRLEEALKIAEDEEKVKEARDVRLIMAQIQFLQKNVDEALRSYEDLEREDPSDFRPYFCKGMIYSLMDRNKEAREEFAKYRELSPKKFEVEGFLRTPLSRLKLFGTNEN